MQRHTGDRRRRSSLAEAVLTALAQLVLHADCAACLGIEVHQSALRSSMTRQSSTISCPATRSCGGQQSQSAGGSHQVVSQAAIGYSGHHTLSALREIFELEHGHPIACRVVRGRISAHCHHTPRGLSDAPQAGAGDRGEQPHGPELLEADGGEVESHQSFSSFSFSLGG